MLNRRVGPCMGFTLVELLIGLVLSAIVGAATLTLTVHHERLARALDRVLLTRRAVREGADALHYDLRALAPKREAIYEMGESFVDFRLTTGFSVICAVDPTHAVVSIPSRDSASSSLTSWIVAPDPGDTVMVLLPATNPDSAVWSLNVLAAAPVRGRPCPSAFADGGDSTPALVLRLTTALPSSVGAGAAIRIVRRARYEIYRASDGAWYLGFVDCLGTRAAPCATIQPVAGPYAARGIQFRFLDSAGSPTATPSHVARIDVSMRSLTTLGPRIPGLTSVFTDSVLFTITPRD